MALSKKIQDNVGIVSTYHRIYEIINKFSDITVYIHSYADKDFRDLEEKIVYTEKNIDALSKEKNMLDKPTESLTDEESARLKEINDLFDLYKEYAGRNIWITETVLNIEYEDSDELSFTTLYEKLKETEIFKGAENC